MEGDREAAAPQAASSEVRAARSVEGELCRLSATFISLPAEVLDDHIERALGRVAEFFAVDRVIVGQEDAAREAVGVSHQWARAPYPRLDQAKLDDHLRP